MATRIPTGLPIHLSDVCQQLYGSSNTSGRTLATCFADATGLFDPTYESINGYRNSLQNFRGYPYSLPVLSVEGWAADQVTIATPGGNWSNPQNVIGAPNNTSAEAFMEGNDGIGIWFNYTDFIQAFDFSLNVPTDATVVGVEFTFVAKSGTGANVFSNDMNLSFLGGGVAATKSTNTTLAGILTEYTIGGSADMWGIAITPTQVNYSSFGLQLNFSRNSDETEYFAYLDAVKAKVYYTEAVSPPL